MAMYGKARLRTKTGCFQCRKQRRKCDERRPVCGNCERSRSGGNSCEWPTGKEAFLDGRHSTQKLKAVKDKPAHLGSEREKVRERILISVYEDSEDSSSTATPEPESENGMSSSSAGGELALRNGTNANGYSDRRSSVFSHDPAPTYSLPSVFKSNEEAWLFSFAVSEFVPSIVHHGADKRYQNHSYSLSMAMTQPVLKNAYMACACSVVSARNKRYKLLAMSYYLATINAIRKGLDSGQFSGTEDFLLATVTLLAVFEGRRSEPSASTLISHVSAMGQLHKLRAAKRAITYSGQPLGDAVAVFERLHAESYFFHASIMMLFDRVIDPELDPDIWNAVNRSIKESPFYTGIREKSPVMGTNIQLFDFVIKISRLRRQFLSSGPQLEDALRLIHINDELTLWYRWLDEDAEIAKAKKPYAPPEWDLDERAGKLYVIAAKILVTLLQDQLAQTFPNFILPPATYESKATLLEEGMRTLRLCYVDVPFCRHFIWPLSVLALTTTKVEQLELIFSKLKIVERRSNGGLAKWVLGKFQDGTTHDTGMMWISHMDTSEFDIRVQEI